MISPPHFPEEISIVLAEQIAARPTFSLATAMESAEEPELAEALPIYVLPVIGQRSAGQTLADMATRTGYWHHQIRTGGSSNHFAKSRPYGPSPSDWQVEEVVESRIAAAIDDTIDWADAHSDMEGEARLLVAPAYYLHALWAAGEHGRVALIDAPAGIEGLGSHHWYSETEFLNAIAANRPAQGLPPLDEEPGQAIP